MKMDVFKIHGGKPLKGTVEIKGAKNAILPLMCASLLTDEPVILKNVSFLSDVEILMQLLSDLGAEIQQIDSDTLRLQTKEIKKTKAEYEYVSKMRASFWVLGPLLARAQEAEVSFPGGCSIGVRPVDLYLMALEKMGAIISLKNGYVQATGPLHGAEIAFQKKSVGATHNTIMAAVLTPGTTIIHNPALEPEVMDLIEMLTAMGADIDGVGTQILTINGVKKLHGVTHTVIPDRIETGSFMMAAAMTKGKVFLKGARMDLLEVVSNCLKPCNIEIVQTEEGVHVDATNVCPKAMDITTSEYPGFPTDLQPIICSFLTLCSGESLVAERIFENRFMHISELQRLGANATCVDGNSAIIKGVDQLTGAQIMASDLRNGFGLLIAALAANGETTLSRVYHIDRGYYKTEEKLTSLGADIVRVKEEF